MYKRIWSLVLTISVFLTTIIPTAASALSTQWEEELMFGETLVIPAELNGHSVRTISSSLFSTEHPEVKKLVFSEGVRLLMNLHLEYLPSLVEVVLPHSLTAIGEGAFTDCDLLTALTVPSGVFLVHEPAKTFASHLVLRGTEDSYIARYAAHHSLAFEAVSPTATPGDVNVDGVCNTTDARLTLQYAADRIDGTTLDLTAADVNGNGSVDTADARIMLQYAAGRAVNCAITAPTKHTAKALISPSAVVTAYYSPRSDRGARSTSSVADPKSAILAANTIAQENYELSCAYYFGLIVEKFTFTEPDGTVTLLRRQYKSGWEFVFEGVVFYGVCDPDGSANLNALFAAAG